MTSGEFSEVDLDLLADYVGGALHGDPDESMIARLVAEDPGWRRAHGELVAALARVDADLHAFAAVDPGPMPADVAARLTTALTGAAADQRPGAQPPATPAAAIGSPDPHGERLVRTTTSDGFGVARHLSAVPYLPGRVGGGDVRPAGGRSGISVRPGRRGLRRSGAGTAAAAVTIVTLAGLGVGVARLAGTGAHDVGSATSAQGDARSQVEAPLDGGPNPPGREAYAYGLSPQQVISSGTGYDRSTVSEQAEKTAGELAAAGQNAGPVQPLAGAVTPAALDRLTAPEALSRCLDAINAAHRAGVAAVQVVDFARFESSPSLVVFFADRAGADWVWVSGPNCGAANAGPDTRHVSQVR